MKSLLTLALLATSALPAFAGALDDLLSDIAEDQLKEYASPFADATTLVTGSGVYHNGRAKGLAGLDVGLKIVTVPFSSGDSPAGSMLDSNGGTDASGIGLPVLVANKGLFKGFQVGARFSQLEFNEDIGDLGLLGASVRFELTELLPLSLVLPRISVQADWSKLEIGDTIENTTTGVDLIVSKSFAIIEPYAGVSMLKGTTKFDYTYEEAGFSAKVSSELDSDMTRLAAGLNFTPFPLLKLNAEYGISDYNTFTVGLLFNLF